jgi:hypothetical protein
MVSDGVPGVPSIERLGEKPEKLQNSTKNKLKKNAKTSPEHQKNVQT